MALQKLFAHFHMGPAASVFEHPFSEKMYETLINRNTLSLTYRLTMRDTGTQKSPSSSTVKDLKLRSVMFISCPHEEFTRVPSLCKFTALAKHSLL